MNTRSLKVSLLDRSYFIHIGSGVIFKLPYYLKTVTTSKRVVVVSDSNVARIYLPQLKTLLTQSGYKALSFIVPAGEQSKSLKLANYLYTNFLQKRVDRITPVIALGGGVIGDLAGFVAATFYRGVPLIQIPTTLLSMVDSSVGGKVGVNHRLGKNMIGAFYQPKFVVSDTNFLNTLPQREFVSGIGEVIKYGIVGDTQFFSFLENSLVNLSAQDPNVLQKIIFYCCRFKANIVCLDERDYNVRRTLNFGHTIGHSLETISGYKKFKHGEAVLLGMKAESYIANQLGILSDSLYRRFATLIDRIPIKVKVSDVPLESILKTMRLDKKNLESNFVFVLPREIGKMQVISSVPDKIIFNALRLLSK